MIEGALGVGSLIVFAHFVTPRDYGAVALLVVIGSVITTVLSAPVGNAIVVRRLSQQRHLSTAWWMSLLPSIAVMFLWSAAVVIVEPSSYVVVALTLSALLPLWAASSVITSIQQQRLDFRRLATVRMAAVIGATASGILVAVLIEGIAGLVVRQLTIPLLQSALGSVVARWRPSWAFDRDVADSVRHYAQGLAAFSLLNQVVRRGDDILVGSVLGATSLGYYSLAYRTIELPLAQVGQMSQNVSLPALTRIDDPASFRAAYLRIQKVLVWLVAPLGVCAIFLGDIAVTTVLGDRWSPAGPIVQIFGAIAIEQAASTQYGLIFMARGATDKLFRYALYWAPPFIVCVLVGLHWGPLGVAWSYLAFNTLLLYPAWHMAGRLVDLSPMANLRSLSVEFGLAAVIAGVGGALRPFLGLGSIAALAAAATVASGVYWGGALLLDSQLRADVLSLVRRSRDLELVRA